MTTTSENLAGPERTPHDAYDVGGVLLARPFKIRRLGHFGLNVLDTEAGLRFYNQMLGLFVSDELDMVRRRALPRPLGLSAPAWPRLPERPSGSGATTIARQCPAVVSEGEWLE